MNIIDNYFDKMTLTESERAEVQKIVNSYDGVNMELFVQRIGGPERIEEMKRVNDLCDRLQVVNGNVVRKKEIDAEKQNLDEWKKGFMEGFEEAYKRLNK